MLNAYSINPKSCCSSSLLTVHQRKRFNSHHIKDAQVVLTAPDVSTIQCTPIQCIPVNFTTEKTICGAQPRFKKFYCQPNRMEIDQFHSLLLDYGDREFY
jgi:hypothetical protein